MLTTLKCVILIPKILHEFFYYSMLDGVPVPKTSISASKWSLLTDEIWTCGHKTYSLWPYIRGWSLSSHECIRTTIGTSKLWSQMRGGLWAQVVSKTRFTVHNFIWHANCKVTMLELVTLHYDVDIWYEITTTHELNSKFLQKFTMMGIECSNAVSPHFFLKN